MKCMFGWLKMNQEQGSTFCQEPEFCTALMELEKMFALLKNCLIGTEMFLYESTMVL